jgi:cob(I)alamin adenosyltransferase
MSIATRTGDDGTTGLMYNRRVPKSHPRVEAYGTVDELNAALGMARATADPGFVADNLLGIQKDLVVLMGELATASEDTARYAADGFQFVTPALTARLDALVAAVEAEGVAYKGWATPGMTVHAAALDMARTTCRRAERRVHAIFAPGEFGNAEVLVYLNRLGDLLWLLARRAETHAGKSGGG